jgi:hypothetical protein
MNRPRRAPYGDVLAFADQALEQNEGLVVECSMARYATNMRMDFYAKRTALRDEFGETKYDDLQVTIKRARFVSFKKKQAVVAVKEINDTVP